MLDLIKEKDNYSKQEIVSLLKITDKSALADLFSLADSIRKKYVGNDVQLRASIDFSNYCSKNCLYCALRRSNEKIDRCRLNKEQILTLVKKYEKQGFKSIILQSGEDPEHNIETLTDTINTIKTGVDIKITMSVGERPEIEYKLMKESGADSYILRHATSDPMLYRQLHPDLKYSNRIKSLRALKQLGFDVGSGVLVGLPGQTFESLANDILLFQTLDIDMVGVEAYIPHPNTPIAKRFEQAGGYFAPAIGYYEIEDMLHKITAITRVVNKRALIPVSTTLKPIDIKSTYESAFESGANMIILNLTEDKTGKYNESCQLKPNITDNELTLDKIEKMLKSMELKLV